MEERAIKAGEMKLKYPRRRIRTKDLWKPGEWGSGPLLLVAIFAISFVGAFLSTDTWNAVYYAVLIALGLSFYVYGRLWRKRHGV